MIIILCVEIYKKNRLVFILNHIQVENKIELSENYYFFNFLSYQISYSMYLCTGNIRI